MTEDLFYGDVAHVGHVELLTPEPEQSERFFVDLLGMEVEARQEQSVYLRGFGDYERYCLKLTEHRHSGLGHLALRTRSPEALRRRVEAVERSGQGLGWIDGDVGHGPAYRFRGPDGHVFELYHESERYQPPQHLIPAMKNQPQRYTGRGMSVRRLDHINLLTRDIATNRRYAQEHLGFRLREKIQLDDGREGGAWMSLGLLAHEVIYVLEAYPTHGRLHHIAFAVDTREEVLRSADLFLDERVRIEAAPSKHSAAQSFYCYAIEPGGNRIEITTLGYLVFDPDAPPTVWTEAEYARGPAWGAKLPESFNTYGTPPYEGTALDASLQSSERLVPGDGTVVRPQSPQKR
jgi:catechol 2,3-dioxygenase